MNPTTPAEERGWAGRSTAGGGTRPWWRVGLAAFDRRLEIGFRVLVERPVSLYGAAALRIGYGLIYLVFLLHEFPHRNEIWGPDSPWTPALARELFHQTGWFSLLTLSDSQLYFQLMYALAAIVCLLFALGWQTRMLSIMFALMVTSFHGRAIFMGDGGDNLLVLMAIYLAFTACGRRWSLDSWWHRRHPNRADQDTAPAVGPAGTLTGWQQAALVRRGLVTVLHNCAMLVIAVEMCFVYGTAGLFKVQGNLWQNGTALYYVMHLDYFRAWPALSDFVGSHLFPITIVSYLTVLVQILFPVALFTRKLKYGFLVMLLGMHLGIMVLLGLPIFSAAMIVGDAVFLPDRFFLALGRIGSAALRRLLPARAGRRPATEPAGVLGAGAVSGQIPAAREGQEA
jgi:hypothetical protein